MSPFSRRQFLGRSLAALGGGTLPGLAARAGTRRGTTLRELADARWLWLGPAVSYNALQNDPTYRAVLAQEFNVLTPENAMKWVPIHPGRYQYSWTQADALVSFALANGMAVHGHTLVWHTSNPGWLTSVNYSRAEMLEILADHIYNVAGHYRGAVVAWDVVNEGFNTDGSLRSTIWSERVGPDYLDWAFRLAAKADPNAFLIYNDWGAESVNAKSNAIYDMVLGMRRRGVPIHGIGFQVHITTGGLNYASFAQNLARFADLGLLVLVTEMDVRIQLPVTPANLAQQANVYRNVLTRFLNQGFPSAVMFQTWGFTDRYSWIPGFYPGYGAALLFDENYVPKPAYHAVAEVLAG